jgi:hypothetical protein
MRKPLENRGKLLLDAADCPLDRLCRQSVSIPFVPLCIQIAKPLANAHMCMCHIAASPRVCVDAFANAQTRVYTHRLLVSGNVLKGTGHKCFVYAVTDVCKSL